MRSPHYITPIFVRPAQMKSINWLWLSCSDSESDSLTLSISLSSRSSPSMADGSVSQKMLRISAISTLVTHLPLLPSSSSVPTRRRYPRSSRRLNLKPLTTRIVLLTRRRQLDQIVEEVESAKKRYGKLNTIVMNSVLEACVHCGDVDLALRMFREMAEPDGCGVDSITYATILKVTWFWLFLFSCERTTTAPSEFDFKCLIWLRDWGKLVGLTKHSKCWSL